MFRLHSIITALPFVFIGLGMGSVLAAEEIFFRWQAASRSLLVTDLTTYAATGESSQQLQSYLDKLNNPRDLNAVRAILNQTAEVDFVAFERYLRSDAGDCMLDHMATLLKPSPRSTAGKTALRAALVNAAAPDGSLSLLDIVSSYPTPQIHFNLDQFTHEDDRDQVIQDELSEIWQNGGLPQAQLQQLKDQLFSGESVSEQQPLNFTNIDYDTLSDISLRICEKLGQPSM